jgi:hypothetical protein
MLDRKFVRVAVPAAVIALATVVVSANDEAGDRFTFTPAKATESGSSDKGPWEIVVTRWSSDADRAAAVEAAADNAPDRLHNAIARGPAAGYIRWPGYLQYTLRYAHRIQRPDGGEDIVLATDQPVWTWWDPAHSPASTKVPFTVIQLRLDKQGGGEGRLSMASRIGSDKTAKGIVLEEFAAQPALLNSVRRAG